PLSPLRPAVPRRPWRYASPSRLFAHRVVGVRRPVGVLAGDRAAGTGVDSIGDGVHRDAAVHRAYAYAKVAANAFRIDDFEVPGAVDLLRDRLVRRVLARDVAAAALDAEILVDYSLFHVVQVQVLPVRHAGHCLADQFRHG